MGVQRGTRRCEAGRALRGGCGAVPNQRTAGRTRLSARWRVWCRHKATHIKSGRMPGRCARRQRRC